MARRPPPFLRSLAIPYAAALCMAMPALAQEHTTPPTPTEGMVVMARTGACYAPTDPLHAGMPAHATFPTMEACMEAGGWDRRAGVPVGLFDTLDPHPLMDAPTPAIAAPRAGMDAAPAEEGDGATLAGWVQDQGCREGRDLLLAVASRAPARWSQDGCRVIHGLWVDGITGAPQTDPARVALAPLVPFAWAEARGAGGWPAHQRSAFARDPANILVLGTDHADVWTGRTPMEQRPADPFKACALANRFAQVVARHPLALGDGDRRALAAAQEEACAAPTAEDVAALHARQAAEQAALRAGFDAARGIDRQDASWGQAIGLPQAPGAGLAAESLARPASPTPLPGPVPTGAEAQGLATRPMHSLVPGEGGDSNAGMEAQALEAQGLDGNPRRMADKPPIAEPGALRMPAPAVPVPTAEGDPAGLAPAPQQPAPDLGPPLRLEDLRRLTLPALVQVLNQDVVVVGFNAPGEPLDPYPVLEALGIDPAEALAELARQGAGDAANGAPATPPAATAAPTAQRLDTPTVQVQDPSLPAFDGDPALMGLATPGSQILMGE